MSKKSPLHCATRKAPIRVTQLLDELVATYWLVYQKVQSSAGWTTAPKKSPSDSSGSAIRCR